MEDPEPPPTLASLPGELLTLVGRTLCSSSLLALGIAAHAFEQSMLEGEEADMLWDNLIRRELGPAALGLAAQAGASPSGLRAFRWARRFKQDVASALEITRGSVSTTPVNADVVACPCLATLVNYGIGAQGAVRRAGGQELEAALAKVDRPLAPLSATLVPGGALAPAVAMVVTTPPDELSELLAYEVAIRRRLQQGACSMQRALEIAISKRMHAALFAAVRAAGHRSLAMPTLGTGGIGLHAAHVCEGLALALADDVRAHPGALLRLRVACFEAAHATYANEAKGAVVDGLFEDEAHLE